MAEKQLRMCIPNLDRLPELTVPNGYELRTYEPGDEFAWAYIMSTGIGEWTAEKCYDALISRPQFEPDCLFFVLNDGIPVGSACAWRESPDEHKHGYLHMVCVLPEHRGSHLGYTLTLAVLHYFRDHGFQDAILDTDDWRLAAIKTYLRLGFEPFYYDDSHRERWRIIRQKLEYSGNDAI